MNNQLTTTILQSLLERFPKTKENVVTASRMCSEDTKRMEPIQLSGFLWSFSQYISVLKSIEGRTVKRVWLDSSKNEDVTSEEYDPRGILCKLKIELEPIKE